jgi:phage/plasmid-like protein (TIGR03299 family)
MLTTFKEVVTYEEAFDKAGLNWKVTKEPLLTHSGLVVPDSYAVVKENGSREVLSTVGGRYQIIQNHEEYDFIKALTETDGLIIKQAGYFNGGKRTFFSLALPKNILIANIPQEEHEIRLTISSSHDGSSPLVIQIGAFRLICSNGMMVSVGEKNEYRIRHSLNALQKIAQARESLKMSWDYVNSLQKVSASLIERSFTSEEMERMALKLLGYTEKDGEEAATRTLNQARQIVNTFANAEDLGHVRNTRWAALNAVTHYIDHEKPVRGALDEREGKRLENSLFGRGSIMRQEALELLTV